MRELTTSEVTGLVIVLMASLVLGTKIALELIDMIGQVVQSSFEAGNVEYHDCTFQAPAPKTASFTCEIPSHIHVSHDDDCEPAQPEADPEHVDSDPSHS